MILRGKTGLSRDRQNNRQRKKEAVKGYMGKNRGNQETRTTDRKIQQQKERDSKEIYEKKEGTRIQKNDGQKKTERKKK